MSEGNYKISSGNLAALFSGNKPKEKVGRVKTVKVTPSKKALCQPNVNEK